MKLTKTIFALFFFVLSSLNESLAKEEFTQEASVYAVGRYGKKMANGDYLSSRHRACSHEFLPVGSLIEITNLANNRSEIVEVNGKSQTTVVELTHSVAHYLGLLGSHKIYVKVVVVIKSKENIANSLTSTVERQNNSINSGSQPSLDLIVVYNNQEFTKALAKKKYQYSMDFPQYEPIKFDSVTNKFLIISKSIVPKEEQIYKEKIIMI